MLLVVVEIKRSVAIISVFCIIISKFGHWQKSNSIISPKIYKYLKVALHNIILSFYLTIGL